MGCEHSNNFVRTVHFSLYNSKINYSVLKNVNMCPMGYGMDRRFFLGEIFLEKKGNYYFENKANFQ